VIVGVTLFLSGADFPLQRAADALRHVGLDHRLKHYPAQLSGGEQQRVAVARAFVGKPKLLLADEPTGNLDGATGRAIMDLLFSLVSASGATLLLITHDEALAHRCRRVVHIADGRIAGDTLMAA
jgi:putative ABC transport system ATP-binding protein